MQPTASWGWTPFRTGVPPVTATWVFSSAAGSITVPAAICQSPTRLRPPLVLVGSSVFCESVVGV